MSYALPRNILFKSVFSSCPTRTFHGFRKSTITKRLAVPAMLMVLQTPLLLSAAQIEVGISGQTIPQRVEAPSLGQPPITPTNASPAVLVPVPPGAGPIPVSVYDELIRRFQHLAKPGRLSSPIATGPAAPLPEVLGSDSGSPSSVKVSGTGTAEGVVTQNGLMTVRLYLRTYRQELMEVQLYNSDGTEILFNGRSLLVWSRPNDTAHAPVYIKGKPDEASMFEEKNGDFSPAKNLSYTFDVQQGQKVVIRTSGQAEPESSLEIRGPLSR